MTNLPPPDPRSSPTNSLGFDEFIGIFIAFTTIGAIVFWSLSHRNEGFNIAGVLSPSPSPSAQSMTPSPQATLSPELEPTVAPTESPEVLTPVPQRTPIGQRIPVVIPFQTTTPATPVPLPPVPTPAASAPPPPVPTPAASAPPSPTLTQPINFLDVPSDFWARPFINALSARSIVTGFPGRYFRPTQPVTRAEFATMLQETFNPNPTQTAYQFKDVPQKFWATPAIELATKAGYLKGFPGNVFRPQQQISKAQVLVALASGLKLANKSSPTNTLQTYRDAAQIPNYATQKIAAATESGLVVNYPDAKLLNPNRPATRAEVAALIYQALVQTGKVEPIQSQYIVPGKP